MKPIIIIYNTAFDCYEAFNEDGRLTYRRGTYHFLSDYISNNTSYYEVSLNSRIGRTILDKLNQKH